ncbi:hypothetical protein [Paracoccus sanguinis]|uniref:Uncharacterized protein n=1 Tax=Paracoccus sanguinis TaxID=1545044 RepID=A0A1H2TIT9_9RHOB|nr:hypothetical protein [Paracoccus sanguinis]SDW43863.1 hypothetical protein SAMN05444276_101972 [Paracoccus sanguinis]
MSEERPPSSQHWGLLQAIVGVSLTAFAYLIAYWWERGYLRSFGISEAFINLTLGRVLTANAYVVSVIAGLWAGLWMLPTWMAQGIAFILWRFFPAAASILVGLYFANGGWGFWFSYFFLAVGIGIVLHELFEVYQGVVTQEGWVARSLRKRREQAAFDASVLHDALSSRFAGREISLILLFLYFCYAISGMLGGWRAFNQSDYVTVKIEGAQFAIVAPSAEGYVAVGFHDSQVGEGYKAASGAIAIVLGRQLEDARVQKFRLRRN